MLFDLLSRLVFGDAQERNWITLGVHGKIWRMRGKGVDLGFVLFTFLLVSSIKTCWCRNFWGLLNLVGVMDRSPPEKSDHVVVMRCHQFWNFIKEGLRLP